MVLDAWLLPGLVVCVVVGAICASRKLLEVLLTLPAAALMPAVRDACRIG